MNIWIAQNGSVKEIIHLPPGKQHPFAICQTPVDPDTGEQVNALGMLDLRYFYITPGGARVDLTDENSSVPAYYRNFVLNTWHTPVPAPTPSYWRLNTLDPWTDAAVTPAPEGLTPVSEIVTPTRQVEAVINTSAKTAYLAAQIAPLKAAKLKQIQAEYETHLGLVKSAYPQSEREAWSQKEKEALAWDALADKAANVASNAGFPLLYEEALQGVYGDPAATKVAKIDVVATRVLTNALVYKAYSGKCTGLLKKAATDIEAATGTYAEIQAYLDSYSIIWPTV